MIGSMRPEYHEGPEARKKFEQGMAKLFKAKKPLAKINSGWTEMTLMEAPISAI
jgi:hypothetical protein